ncbi:MAG: hypothetical protein U1E51_28700 [Candidatus Binatia bacterium]|nr:hypothetical protein [Candidatus Binatia bacterium]
MTKIFNRITQAIGVLTLILGIMFCVSIVLPWIALAAITAASSTPAPEIGTGWVGGIIVFLVPMLIALGKSIFGLDKISRFLPVIAMALAVLLDLVQSLLTNVSMGPQLAAALGLAGVGAREVVDQIRKMGT